MILYQPQNGYCYNSDTHFLFNFIKQNLKQFKNIKGELLDIGSGSGILGLLVAKHYDKLKLNQSEIQDEFVFLSKKNSEINKIDSNIFKGDFLTFKESLIFDYIVSNPPFYPSSVVQSENKNLKIARYNDNLPLEQFISKVSSILSDNGKFFFCYDVKLINDIIKYCEMNQLNIEALQFLHPKVDKSASLVMVYARKNSKTRCKILPPFIMFNEDGEFTKATNDVYKLCATYSIKCEL